MKAEDAKIGLPSVDSHILAAKRLDSEAGRDKVYHGVGATDDSVTTWFQSPSSHVQSQMWL